ncbi:MAG: hypothetical protein N2748_06445 [candidate division WOR-3 bacterium]|nr:hypothetical protein [candidate division WOR-3 bacterium]
MNANEVKNRLFRVLKFLYQVNPDKADAALLEIQPSIAEQPFFINRKTSNIDDYVNAVLTYLNKYDKLKALSNYPIQINTAELSGKQVPANYAEVINRSMSAPGAGAKGGGSGLINIGSLEGLSDVLFAPSETTTQTKTETKSDPAAVKAATGLSTTTIIIIVVVVIALLIAAYFLLKK